jgi:hypothetical protein
MPANEVPRDLSIPHRGESDTEQERLPGLHHRRDRWRHRVGRCLLLYFDDTTFTVRHLVVDTGGRTTGSNGRDQGSWQTKAAPAADQINAAGVSNDRAPKDCSEPRGHWAVPEHEDRALIRAAAITNRSWS